MPVCATQNVFAFQRVRDSHFLDRSGSGELSYRQFLLEPSRQGHFFKLFQSFCTFLEGQLAHVHSEMRVAKILQMPLELVKR